MDDLKKALVSFIENPLFPCIGAKAAIKKKCFEIFIAQNLDSTQNDMDILVNLYQFIEVWKKRQQVLQTFAVIFESPLGILEHDFETSLWNHLQRLHELDKEIYPWDSNVSSNVNNPNFSFSIGAHGFFIVGLHPHSSRKSRQFIRPTLIFNLHAQFERLKDNGKFIPMQTKIRENDLIFSGSINPMLNTFNKDSAALQFSGRETYGHASFNFIKKTHSQYRWETITPCSGTAFILNKGDLLIVQDVKGEQVSDLFCFAMNDMNEFLSSGKSIDYNGKIFFSTRDNLYSNKSNVMLSIINDDVKKHDFLFAPCSKETFKIIYQGQDDKEGCYEHLVQAFKSYNIPYAPITTTFNIFMNVSLTLKGKARVNPPLSKAGDKIIFQSCMDLIVGLTACSAPQSNNYSLKPIRFKILKKEFIE